MRVVATNAGLCHGAVCIDGLEVGLLTDFDGAGGSPFRMLSYGFQLAAFGIARRFVSGQEVEP